MLGGTAGLRTDIDVVATSRPGLDRPSPTVRAIIEIKGSWNPDVLTSLSGQLVRQYLDPHEVRHGLYVVGDFTCQAWADSRAKSRSAAIGGRTNLQQALDAQAQSATNGIREVRARVLDTSLPSQAAAAGSVLSVRRRSGHRPN